MIHGFKKNNDSIKAISFINNSLNFDIPLYLSYFINIKDFNISFDVIFYFEEKLKDIIFNKLVNLNKIKI